MDQEVNKNKKFQIKSNHIYIVILFLAIVHNSYIHIKYSTTRYYQRNFQQVRDENQKFQNNVKRLLVENLLTLTNFNFTAFNQSSHIPAATITNFNQNLSQSFSITNIPDSLTFDHYFEFDNMPFVQMGIKRYTVGDKIYGFPISYISPRFVLIGNRFFPVAGQVTTKE